LRGRKDTVTPVVSTLRGRAPPSFRRLWSQSQQSQRCSSAVFTYIGALGTPAEIPVCPLVKTAVRCSLRSGVVVVPYSVRLSQRNRTVVVSIHQPRYAIFRLFDRLTLLAAGRVIYHGKATEALDFFQTLGIF